MLLMQAYSLTGEYLWRGKVLQPISTIIKNLQLYTESERSLPVGDQDLVCKRIHVSFHSTPAVFAYVDPKVNLPIYLGFPATKTEALLESYYGENPTPYYQRLDSEEPSD
jgi:hypothetical protein